MKILIPVFRFFIRFYWIKKKLIQYSKIYVFKYCVLPIIEEIKHEKLCTQDYLDLDFAVNSESFKGLLEYYLKPNNYNLKSKDIAVALNIGIFGHSNKTLNHQNLINISSYITEKIKERIIHDENFKYIINELGKDVRSIQSSDRKEIERIFTTKKQIFETYFNIFSSEFYSERMTVYYPGENKTWIEWKEEDSLVINIYKYDIPCGVFLTGFDYRFENNWLKSAIRIGEKEYFNPTNKTKGKIIWQQ